MLLEIPTVNEIIGELSEDETKIYNEIVENFIDKSNKMENLIGGEIIVQINKKLISSRVYYRLKIDFKRSNWNLIGSYYNEHVKFFISPVYKQRGIKYEIFI